jgi:hypothetical protein
MILPNRENIDRWLFDYTEGNLSVDQENLLENFILNNPDIEVDLDAWQDAKLVPEETLFADKEKFKRKRRFVPIYFSGIILTLVLSIMGLYFSLNSGVNQKLASHDKKEFIQRNKHSVNTKINLLNQTKDKSIEGNHGKSNKATLNSINNNNFAKTANSINNEIIDQVSSKFLFEQKLSFGKMDLVFATKSKELVENSSYQHGKMEVLQNSSASGISKIYLKPIDSKSLKLHFYQIRNEELQLLSDENQIEGINLILGNVKIFNKISKVLEKDLGLSNIPDHTYSIPEYSNVDVLFSNIGATSQFRFQSTTMARWIENVDQRKLSQQITLDGYSRGAQSGFGLQANYDHFANGSIQNWNTCLLFSPKIAISRSVSIEPALRFKIGNKLLNEDRIQNHSIVSYESQTSNQFNFDSSIAIGSKLWYRDLDLGFTINTPYFYIGSQVSNILRHQNNIYSNVDNVNMRAQNVYNAIIGTQYISRNQKIQFSPYLFFEKISTNRVFAGFSLKLNKIMLGGSYGTGNIASGTLGLSLNNFAICAQSSYGYAPAIAKYSFTHQLTIRFNSNVDKKSRRYITF